MKKLKWMICIPVAICMLFAVAFSGCTVGEVDTEVHHWDDGEVTTEPTCEKPGEKTYYCTDEDCDATKTEEIAALGHSWDKGTDNNDGTITYKCERCGATETLSSDADPDATHNWDDGVTTKEATCGEDGEITYTCTDDDCGATKTEVIPATGEHTWDTAALDANGKMTQTCEVCGQTKAADVTIKVDLPSAVSIDSSSYTAYDSTTNTITGFTSDSTLTSSSLPTQDQLTFSGSSDSAFGSRTLQGWYVKSTNEDTSINNTMISSYSLGTTTEITIAPYWSYPSGFEMMYFNSASGNRSTGQTSNVNVENIQGMSTDVHSKYSVSNVTSYTTVIDAIINSSATSFDYAVPATVLQNTSGVSSGDQFRCATTVPNSDNVIANDNIEFYEFQNQGTVACYFKVYLTNSTMDKGTSYMYIYLNPGETVIFLVSLEFSSGTTPNNSLLVFTAADAATSLKLAVANGFLPGSSATTHGGSFTYTDLLNQGFNIYSGSSTLEEGNYSSSAYSETSFIAYLTDSTAGSLNSAADVYEISGQAPASAALTYASIDLADVQTSTGIKD